jgi:hypothetical protein
MGLITDLQNEQIGSEGQKGAGGAAQPKNNKLT